ncbi:toll/interleukin-1 receptor domain-containing protein [Amycolatopsis sp. NPDC021455]|uniref:toll/interleukin-1 receptor domain-containing protein n=1 Tax=Amycolatopsis sp. NPDC021455 TaxID=3154901 RepID=UPI0033D50310
MSVFVSYARADNTLDDLVRLRKDLSGFCEVYVDDLDWPASGLGRLESVRRGLFGASVFVAVVSENYRKTPWTAWEFGQATLREIPKLAYLPTGRLVAEDSADWPFDRPAYGPCHAGAGTREPGARGGVTGSW